MSDLRSAFRFLLLCGVATVGPAMQASASTPQPANPPPVKINYQTLVPTSMVDDISSEGSPIDQTNKLLRRMIDLSEKFSRQAASAPKDQAVLARALDQQEAAFIAFHEAVKDTSIGPTIIAIYNPSTVSKTDSLDERARNFASAMERTYKFLCMERISETDLDTVMVGLGRLDQTLEKNLAGYQVRIGFQQEHRPKEQADLKFGAGGV